MSANQAPIGLGLESMPHERLQALQWLKKVRKVLMQLAIFLFLFPSLSPISGTSR
jgi:hypothetical protein